LSRPIYTHYRVFMDGSQMAWPNTDGHGTSQPVVLGEGGSVSAGYVPAGRHHFAIAEAGGGATIFAGDGDIPAGSLTRLYLFGPSGALQGRFVSHRELPPPGMLHVSAMNLMRDGRRIEVVSCADPTDCVSLSPPLALGESFDADFAAAPLEMPDASVPDDRLAGGAGLSYRAVPTDALPVPWLQPLIRGITLHPSIGTPANLVAAPNHMDADGRVLSFQI
jgi:hypothetical protein